jgi:Fe-S cluster assembly protein SufD
MLDNNYIYAPTSTIEDDFKCRVPLDGTNQLFVINGLVQGGKDPLAITIDEGHEMKDILQIISVRTKDSSLHCEISNNITFKAHSSGSIILCSHTFSLDDFTTNEITNINIEKGAKVEIVLMQNEHNNALHNTLFNINIAEDATFKMTFITLHGGKIKNDIKVSLNGEKIDCDLSGIYLVDGKQVVNNSLLLIHNFPNCKSNQLFKGILDNSAIAHFTGLIKVVQDAQKTEAYQANHNLLLSTDSKIYTQPHLEIYADDVKCSHGATIGRLDEMELFYMRSRGIPAKEAKLLQQLAFAFAVVEKISNPQLRERVQNLIESRLRGEFSECRNCSKNCC